MRYIVYHMYIFGISFIFDATYYAYVEMIEIGFSLDCLTF